MRMYLMHKNIAVADMEVSADGELSEVHIIASGASHLPLGCQLNMMKFHEWWNDRAVPVSRTGASSALERLGIASTKRLLVNNLALSMSDCYWVKPVDSDLQWEQVSLFSNRFVDVFGRLTFDSTSDISNWLNETKYSAVASQGDLCKSWDVDFLDVRFLIKGNRDGSYQQSINEVFASLIHEKQGITDDFEVSIREKHNVTSYTKYHASVVRTEDGGHSLGCGCLCFCNENVEFVSAWELLQTVKMKKSDSYFFKFKEICLNLCGFAEEYFNQFMSYQICTDFLMSNTDRHMNNIGVLRNPDTLQYIGFAPIFDTGNSMFFDLTEVPRGNLLNLETCSFVKREVDLLKYVTARDIVDLNKLPSEEEFNNYYAWDTVERGARAPLLYNAFRQKVGYLRRFQSGEDLWKTYKRK